MAEAFELAMLGGAFERRYRRLRPDVERLPWGTLDPRPFSREAIAHARRFWTRAAFQEHRTAAACAAAVEGLIAARAPVDLVAVASRFILDEMAHVELCARVAGELGGGVALPYDARALYRRPPDGLSPLARVGQLIIEVFCVGEAFSVRMQRATAKAVRHPLLRAVVARIARDEAAHGAFGWTFLDWADDALTADEHARLAVAAREAVAGQERMLEGAAPSAIREDDALALGWLPRATYLPIARRELERAVRAPLRARGFLDTM